METVTAEIDVTNPTDRKGISGIWFDLDDVIERGFDKLSEHYGVDMRVLTSKYSKYYKPCSTK